MHIAFLEMVIDPACSLVFEAETEEDDVMRRPPRAPDEPLFSGPLVGWSQLQGALTFFSLVLAIVSRIFVNRSFSASPATALRRPNDALAWVPMAVTTMLGLNPALAVRERPLPLWRARLQAQFGREAKARRPPAPFQGPQRSVSVPIGSLCRRS